VKETDIVRIGQNLQAAGKLLIDHGSRALAVTASWQHGPSTAGGEPVRRSRETPMPAVPLEGRDLIALNHELRSLMQRLDLDEHRLRIILRTAVPDGAGKPTSAQKTPAQAAIEGWCRSCFRDHGYLEPIAMRPDGNRKYRDYCNWCGGFKGEYGIEPPEQLVEARHRGQRITQPHVAAALAKHEERKKQKRKPSAA
jgi:hypothetical protein